MTRRSDFHEVAEQIDMQGKHTTTDHPGPPSVGNGPVLTDVGGALGDAIGGGAEFDNGSLDSLEVWNVED